MKPAHAAIPLAASRRAAAAGFSLVEVLVVLLLLLALAAIAMPVAATWFSDASAEQTLDSVTLAIRDEQLEAMVTRTPRAVWIGPREAAVAADAMSTSATNRPPGSGRWCVGGERLAPPSPESVADPSPARPARRESVVLPRGWTLAVEAASSADVAAAPGATTEEPSVPAASPASPASASSRLAVFWPGGQVDVLGRLLVSDSGGREWSIDLDPWTGVPAWHVRSIALEDSTVRDRSERTSVKDGSP
ncbi:MAG: prepilin-type N-terminal cleavage/methylation domain-containing protein [Phycisphaerae bacterium]|jgi:prepilin-type N-terminal cleavage/methylation domain-containing protein